MKTKLVILCVAAAMPFLFLLLAEGYLREHEGLNPGDLLPAARLQSPGGTELDTRSLLGRSSLLVLFLPSCKACRNQIKALESVAASLPALRIILVSMDPAATPLSTPFPIYVDPSGEFVSKVRKISVPVLYWVGPNGRILYARTGERPAEADASIFKALL